MQAIAGTSHIALYPVSGTIFCSKALAMKNIQKALKTARRACQEAVFSDELPEALSDAYASVLETGEKVAAWKIGGANPWSRRVFANDEVFFGPLFDAEVIHQNPDLDLSGLFSPLAEPEISLRINDPEATDFGKAFDALALSLEIPASVLPADRKSQLAGQIMDRAGAGALWIGPLLDMPLNSLSEQFETSFWHNDNPAIVGHSANILPSLTGAAMEFLSLAKRYEMPLEHGQWVASGGLNPAVAVQPGDVIRFEALGAEISVTFL